MIKDLPKMYQHCKETEEPDLTAFDFITDHLIDFDAIFEEKHQNNKEKPHQSNTNLQTSFSVQLNTPQQIFVAKEKQQFCNVETVHYSNYAVNYTYTFSSTIFHPPLV